MLGQLVEDRGPRSPPRAQTVYEQQGAAVPASDVVQRHSLNAIPRGKREGRIPKSGTTDAVLT
ncbi:hypothetical protein GCM10009807_28860 [Microbacterium lacus]|uniref:Uncharacterized protein n=1 Tax=Microbacterium lacus TaxID=415217 RepID=A0ABN2H7G9_9MICO